MAAPATRKARDRSRRPRSAGFAYSPMTMPAVDWFSAEETRFVTGSSGRFAFRRGGREGGTPLVLCQRFRGTIDDWDPALLAALAAERDVVVFDNFGVGLSSGAVPSTVAGMSDAAVEFLLLGVERVDVFGWSMGGFVALDLALAQPRMVRRLIVAGSKPGLIPEAPLPDPEVGKIASKPVNDKGPSVPVFPPDAQWSGGGVGVPAPDRSDRRSQHPHPAGRAGHRAPR